MTKLLEYRDEKAHILGYMFMCPGCDNYHMVQTHDRPDTKTVWAFNESLTSPTFTPSLLFKEGNLVCHSTITDGVIYFQHDCTHELAGQLRPLLELA